MDASTVLKTETTLKLFKENADVFRPASLWKWFLRVTEIPRGSGNVKAIAAEIQKIAGEMGLVSRTDATGNVCVAIPATPGLESLPKTIIQCHMDMVVAHDEDKRPEFSPTEHPIIPELRDDGFLYAKGTRFVTLFILIFCLSLVVIL